MSRSLASMGCGAILLYLFGVLLALVGGYWLAWGFTAYTMVPWMEVPGEWSKLTSVLLTIFVTGPVAVSIIGVLEFIVVFFGGLILVAVVGRRSS
jgi:hypothetical protein